MLSRFKVRAVRPAGAYFIDVVYDIDELTPEGRVIQHKYYTKANPFEVTVEALQASLDRTYRLQAIERFKQRYSQEEVVPVTTPPQTLAVVEVPEPDWDDYDY